MESELAGVGDVELDEGTLTVEVEVALTFLDPVHDSISARGPFGGDLWMGFEATQLRFKLDGCGGVDGRVAMFMDRGAVGGLGRAGGVDEASIGTDGEIGCWAFAKKVPPCDAHLPCPGGVPRPGNGGGGATAGRGGNRAIEYGWRLGRGGRIAGGSGVNISERRARGGMETNFELKFVAADGWGRLADVSRISPSSCAKRRALEFVSSCVGRFVEVGDCSGT